MIEMDRRYDYNHDFSSDPIMRHFEGSIKRYIVVASLGSAVECRSTSVHELRSSQ